MNAQTPDARRRLRASLRQQVIGTVNELTPGIWSTIDDDLLDMLDRWLDSKIEIAGASASADFEDDFTAHRT